MIRKWLIGKIKFLSFNEIHLVYFLLFTSDEYSMKSNEQISFEYRHCNHHRKIKSKPSMTKSIFSFFSHLISMVVALWNNTSSSIQFIWFPLNSFAMIHLTPMMSSLRRVLPDCLYQLLRRWYNEPRREYWLITSEKKKKCWWLLVH